MTTPINNFLILASPHGDIRQIKDLLKNNMSKRWVYFGSDFLAFSALERQLADGFTCLDIREQYRNAVESVKFEFTASIDALNRKYGADIEWWMEAVFSRNNYSSELFQNACHLDILRKLLSEKGIIPDIVFVEKAGFTKDILAWAQSHSRSVFVQARPLRLKPLAEWIKPLLDWSRFLSALISRGAAASLSRRLIRQKKAFPRDAVIIQSFIHDASLSRSGELTDRYLPFLHEYAERKEIRTVVHPVLFGFTRGYLSIYARMRTSRIPFIIKEDFLKLGDYVSALSLPLRARRRKVDVKNSGFSHLAHSIKEMRSGECYSAAMNAVLAYRLFSRLKKAGFKPKRCVLWFENQVMDKAVIAGLKAAFPSITIAGAQMFLHPPNLLSLFPVESEVEAGVAPDMLIETSRFQCDRASIFTRSIPCRVGAALRYAHVFKKDGARPPLKLPQTHVLIVLPFDLAESIEILALVKDSLTHLKQPVVVLVKTHPDCNIERIIKSFGRSSWPGSFSTIGGSLVEALKRTSIMISANSSSMVEALACGIPVIYAGSRIMINQNILTGIDPAIARECFTPAELTEAINDFSSLDDKKSQQYEEIANAVKYRYFTPVTDETLAPFFERH
ncbi:MAG: hypothetical protein WC695_03950 [Candidatus Omnitrophota bacterium]